MGDFVRCIAVFGALVCCSSWSVLADLPMMDSDYELLPMMDSNNEVLPTMVNWEWYKALHHKTFHNDSHEEMRRETWFDKLEKIIQHNREEDETGEHGFKLEVNHLTDLLPHEYGKLLGYRGRNSTKRVERGADQGQSSDSKDSNDSSLDSKYSSDSSRSSEDTSDNSLNSEDSGDSSSDSEDSSDNSSDSEDSSDSLLSSTDSGDSLLGSEHWHHKIRKPSIPETVNWTAEGWVNPVQDQGHCGSCWSFSACGVIEAQYYNATKRSVILSEEQLVECSSDYGNNRCDGGDMSYAFQYIERNGIESFADYPYTNATYHGQPGSCSYAPSRILTRLLTWNSVPGGNEHALKHAVATFGPISVAIDAASHKFQLYSQGVYQNPDCRSTNSDLDHGVLLVGYGTEEGKPYWLIKNSVGWGDNGYVKILRDNSNMCGVATVPQFALIR